MAYIVGKDRTQDKNDNFVRVIDTYPESLDLIELGFIEYS